MAWVTLVALLVSAAVQHSEPPPADAAAGIESVTWLKIDPTEARIGMFYNGTAVDVEAALPAGYDAAVLCIGRADTVELKTKGRALGLLWMNVGEVVFEDVPSLYVLASSRALNELASPQMLEDLELGYQALESRAATRERGDEHEMFRELLKLKESERLYSFNEGAIGLESDAEGVTRVSTRCDLPAKAPSGDYEVRLLAFSGGRGEVLQVERLRLTPVGSTAFVSSLAQRHGFLYGMFAVVIALVFGLLTGFVFGLLPKTGH